VEGAAVEIRKSAHNLMPEVLHHHGLAEAVHSFCVKIGRSNGLNVTFQCLGTSLRLNEAFELVVYRIVQELLHNTVRHAQATQALVQLSFAPGVLSLTVEDNGIGFDPAAVKRGIGLANLQSRADAYGGRVDVDSFPGKGTATYIEFNLDNLTLQNDRNDPLPC
jgi:signal transduction histidine kinase